jgi:hypothetical protein
MIVPPPPLEPPDPEPEPPDPEPEPGEPPPPEPPELPGLLGAGPPPPDELGRAGAAGVTVAPLLDDGAAGVTVAPLLDDGAEELTGLATFVIGRGRNAGKSETTGGRLTLRVDAGETWSTAGMDDPPVEFAVVILPTASAAANRAASSVSASNRRPGEGSASGMFVAAFLSLAQDSGSAS